MSAPPSLQEPSKRKKITSKALALLLASIFGVLVTKLNLDYLEAWFYDFRMQTRLVTKPTSPIELILVKPSTVELYKGAPKFEHYTELLRQLQKENPRYVLITAKIYNDNERNFEVDGSFADKSQFADIAARFPKLFVTTDNVELKGEQGRNQMPIPLDRIPVVAAPATWDKTILAKDGVTRRLVISAYEQVMLHPLIAQEFNPKIKDLKQIRGQLHLLESNQAYIDFRPSQSFPETKFEDFLNGNYSLNRFKDKIVIIGWDYRRSSKDYILTPYDRDSVMAMSIAEMHANMLNTLIENSAPQKLDPWLNTLLTILISVFTVYIVLTVKPATGLMVMGLTLLGFGFFAWILFWPFGLWITVAHPVVAVFLCYYFFIPYRLIVENRRSWEYYQKNRLLRQVEELKTNFISMMSHDLKTPLARIQGMTDVILQDSTSISSQQREAVDTIKQSSSDLLSFINTILNYGKIESQGVELHLQSKDVNALLNEVIRKHEFHAKLKKIVIKAELDPLFPIEIDPDLIKQVFSNLVENAIKYSPEDTKILVSSEELGSKVIVQVADQGAGIPADELPNIFMKFFRSKNAKTSPIKGSGLGLYLAMYFTELHQGSLFVESTYGQGSTFTVELPIVRKAQGV